MTPDHKRQEQSRVPIGRKQCVEARLLTERPYFSEPESPPDPDGKVVSPSQCFERWKVQ
jgi:hypothetical protein